MTQVPAKIKINGKTFEIVVDCDKAMNFKKNRATQNLAQLRDILAFDGVFSDFKKGDKVPEKDLIDAFKTTDISVIAQKIINEGEVHVTQEYREKQREMKEKQIIEFIIRNCADPRTKAPFTPDRISSSMKQVGVKVDENRATDEQALSIIKMLEKILPIKMEVKRIKVVIPATHVGKAYGVFKDLKKESEDWLQDGSMSVIVNIPAGMQLEFYDKLNSSTQGDNITEEIQE